MPTLLQPKRAYALHGTRGTGKDSLCRHLHALDSRCRRYAFADQLRFDLSSFVRAHYGLDIWTTVPAEKELIRPLLIAHGMAKRAQDVDHWVKQAIAKIRHDLESDPTIVPVLTDARFVNEVVCLRREFGEALFLVDLTREGSPPPTNEEEKHYRQVASMAQYQIHWGNNPEDKQRETARDLLKWAGIEAAP